MKSAIFAHATFAHQHIFNNNLMPIIFANPHIFLSHCIHHWYVHFLHFLNDIIIMKICAAYYLNSYEREQYSECSVYFCDNFISKCMRSMKVMMNVKVTYYLNIKIHDAENLDNGSKYMLKFLWSLPNQRGFVI